MNNRSRNNNNNKKNTHPTTTTTTTTGSRENKDTNTTLLLSNRTKQQQQQARNNKKKIGNPAIILFLIVTCISIQRLIVLFYDLVIVVNDDGMEEQQQESSIMRISRSSTIAGFEQQQVDKKNKTNNERNKQKPQQPPWETTKEEGLEKKAQQKQLLGGQQQGKQQREQQEQLIIEEQKQQQQLHEEEGYYTTATETLPKWITNYVEWHNRMRQQYPGMQLLTDPEAPNIIVRVCLGLCGGLNDRLGQLAWDLYLANQTNRILMFRWERPKPIEDFLIPNQFNWSLPPTTPGFKNMRDIRDNVKKFFDGYNDEQPEDDFWSKGLDASIDRAGRSNTGAYKDVKVLRHRLLGHINEKELETRLLALNETDLIHNTSSFGKIFNLFFKPNPFVQQQLTMVYDELQIAPHEYSAVHCRVRHPKATPAGVLVLGKHPTYPADKTGLPWYGHNRHFAIETAIHALSCAKQLLDHPKEPIYFFSDSNDLVHYMSHQLKDQEFLQANRSLFVGTTTTTTNTTTTTTTSTEDNNNNNNNMTIDAKALQLVQPMNVIARNVSVENAHLDRQKGRPPEAYYGTFVDFFLAINARCVTYGIGYYAVFATKISGISCKLLYQEELWGGLEDNQKQSAPLCSINNNHPQK